MKTAKNPEKKRFRLFSYLFNTRMGTMIFSIITAIFLWFAISINLYPTTPRTISHIPLTVDITGTAAELNGYSVIDYSVKEVTVQIEGNRSQVGNLDANDMIATPVVENVTSSGGENAGHQRFQQRWHTVYGEIHFSEIRQCTI